MYRGGKQHESWYILSLDLRLTIYTALASAIRDNADIKDALQRVDSAMDMYARSVIKLNAMLSRDAALKKQKGAMLDWLLPGRPWEEKHLSCRRRRVDGIGNWVFDTDQFKAWHGNLSKILLCDGAGTVLPNEILILCKPAQERHF